MRRVGGRALGRVRALRRAVVGALLLRRRLRELERRDHISKMTAPRGASTSERVVSGHGRVDGVARARVSL